MDDAAPDRPLTYVEPPAAEPSEPPVPRLRSATDLLGRSATGFAIAWNESAAVMQPHAAVEAAERVSSSRALLYQCLIDLGWDPPDGVVEGIRLDARLSQEGLGGCYDGIPAHTSGRVATAVVFISGP